MYQPQYVNNTSDFIRRHGGILLSVLGKTLSEAWVIWDNEDNEWFPDGPVLLDFDGVILEFCCNIQ